MKNFYLLLFFLFAVISLQAQETLNYKKHFVSFRAGYSIPVSSSQIGSPRSEVGKTYVDEIVNSSGATVSYSEKNSFGSRGAGFNFSLGYGYMINQNFSFEIDFNYLYTLGFDDAYINKRDVSDQVVYNATQRSQTSMFRITPMFGVYANENLLIRPYAKFGLIVPLAGGTTVNLSIDDNTGVAFNDLMPVISESTFNKTQALLSYTGLTSLPIGTKTDIKAVTSGAFSVGFLGRFGAEYKFKNIADGRLKLFAEMEMQMLTVKAKQTIIKEFYSTLNNEAVLNVATDREVLDAAEIDFIQTEFTEKDIPEILRTTDYLNEIIETSNSTYDISNPNYDRTKAFEQLTFRDNYNAFGFLIGMKFSF